MISFNYADKITLFQDVIAKVTRKLMFTKFAEKESIRK